MANGNKQQSLFSNPLALFLTGVGIVLIAMLVVAVLQPGGQLKTAVPPRSEVDSVLANWDEVLADWYITIGSEGKRLVLKPSCNIEDINTYLPNIMEDLFEVGVTEDDVVVLSVSCSPTPTGYPKLFVSPSP